MSCCSSQIDAFESSKEEDRRQIKFAAYSVFVITLLLVVCRSVAYVATNSIAVKASILDAVKDWIVSSLNALFLLKSIQAANAKFPFGYGKIEALAALFQSMLLLGIGGVIVGDIFCASNSATELVYSPIAIAVLGVSIVGSLILVLIQTRVANKVHSLAIRADAAHYKSDVVVNVGVLIGLLVSYAAHWIDIVIGGVIAVYLICVSIKIGASALAVLLDRSLGPAVEVCVRAVVARAGGNVHSIRTHSLGRGEFIAIELNEDGKTKIAELQKKSFAIEEEIHQIFKKSFVIIGIRPQH
ncbi:MAG: cation diffusion facilitator family transporter [Holosporales bacterium]|jgi:ferrous-iron efflux pump FieF|nr:cation diffusion facilitator family transporter [Holosporales bacterium]